MKLLFLFLGWTLLLVLCWPLAFLFLLVWPVLWLLSIPFRILASLVEAVLELIRALLFLPVRILGGGPSRSG